MASLTSVLARSLLAHAFARPHVRPLWRLHAQAPSSVELAMHHHVPDRRLPVCLRTLHRSVNMHLMLLFAEVRGRTL